DQGRSTLQTSPQFLRPVEVVGKNLDLPAKRIRPVRVLRWRMTGQRSDFISALQQKPRRVLARVAERPGDGYNLSHKQSWLGKRLLGRARLQSGRQTDA